MKIYHYNLNHITDIHVPLEFESARTVSGIRLKIHYLPLRPAENLSLNIFLRLNLYMETHI